MEEQSGRQYSGAALMHAGIPLPPFTREYEAYQFVFTELKEAEALYEKVQKWCERNTKNRMVISIYGGSGSGKTTLATALHEGKDTITLRHLEREDGEISSEETDFPEYLYCFWSGRTEEVTIYMVWIYPSFWKVPRRRQRSGASAETATRMPQARLSAVWWNWNRKNSKCSAKMQD